MTKAKSPPKPRTTGGRGAAAQPRKVVDALDQRLAAAQRVVLYVIVVLSAVAVWRPLPDPFMVAKLAVICVGAVVLLALSGLRAVRSARAVLPNGPPVWIAAAFVVALLLATAGAESVGTSVVGQHGRYGGLLAYLAYAAVFMVVVRVYATRSAQGLIRALILALALVTAYGLVQAAGWDPYEWSSGGLAQTFSTMGNINFAAGYVGTVLPLVTAVVVLSGWSTLWRLSAGVLLLASAIYLVAAQSAQGPIAAAAGLVVVGVGWLLGRPNRGALDVIRRLPRWVVPATVVIILVAAALLATRFGPVLTSSLSERRYFWGAALGVFADHPALGTGLDAFRNYFTEYRAPEHGVLLGFDGADSPHSLPLGMLTGGGVPLAATYLALVGYTGWTLVRGLLAAAPQQLLPLAGFGGVWTAYQVQSLVSVDVPPLTLLHFLSAGIVIAVAGRASVWSRDLPISPAARGSLLPHSRARGRGAGTAAMAAVVVLAVFTAWMSIRPLRADLAAAGARGGAEPAEQVTALDAAVKLAPWEAEYRLLQAQARFNAGDQDGAYAALIAAAELRSGSSRLALNVVDFAGRLDDEDAAAFWTEEALRRDPNNPSLLEEVAGKVRATGDEERADALERRAAALRVDHADY